MSKYATAFLELRSDYRRAAGHGEKKLDEYSPIKEVSVLNTVGGVPSETLTHMHGKAIEGYTIDKTIYVNDEKNQTDDDVILLDPHHDVIEHYHNDGLTRLRCGLMTCVALSEAMRLMKMHHLTRVGFIGNGETNIKNAECISDIFDVHDFVIRGSSRCRSKNIDRFARFGTVTVDDTDDLSLLNTCDAVVSCTSTVLRTDQISTKVLSKPRIMIALDTGYLLDESFRRECESYADDVDQLEAYYHEEFIFDEGHVNLKQLETDTTVDKDRICVYMFGISFADAEVALMRHTHKIKE